MVVNPTKPFLFIRKKYLMKFLKWLIKKYFVQLVKIILRLWSWSKEESIIPMLIEKIKNKKINVNFPANINDYIYIDDVVKIINYFLMNSIKTGIYNLGTGKEVSK